MKERNEEIIGIPYHAPHILQSGGPWLQSQDLGKDWPQNQKQFYASPHQSIVLSFTTWHGIYILSFVCLFVCFNEHVVHCEQKFILSFIPNIGNFSGYSELRYLRAVTSSTLLIVRKGNVEMQKQYGGARIAERKKSWDRTQVLYKHGIGGSSHVPQPLLCWLTSWVVFVFLKWLEKVKRILFCDTRELCAFQLQCP